MKKPLCFLTVLLFLLTACGGSGEDADSALVEPSPTEVVIEEAPTEPPAMPTPTDASGSPQGPALITTADEMAGIWLGTVAGESGYVMYTEDGRYLVALSQDALATAPRVSGEYWFEDGQVHLRDLENAGHWAECDSDSVGIYDVVDLGDGQIQFQVVDDSCGGSGFTRNYFSFP